MEKNPNYTGFLLLKAIISIKKNDLDLALETLNQAAALNDKTFEEQILLNLGALKIRKEDYEGAISDCKSLLAINPSSSGAYNTLGIAYYKMDKYQDAINNFDQALEIEPDNTTALYNRGMCYYKQNLKPEACIDFQRSCRLRSQNACKMVVTYCITPQKKE